MEFSTILSCMILFTLPISISAQSIDDASLQKKLNKLRERAELVGAGALVMVDGKIVAVASSGERKLGSGVAVTTDDKWHHGSITKSMTATVIAKLVERGEIDWDDSLSSLLPKRTNKNRNGFELHSDFADVTIQNLLTHSSGIRANVPTLAAIAWPEDRKSLHDARRRVLRSILRREAKEKRGKMLYSNVGYTLAGYIAAEKSQMTWEELMERELFKPLDLKTAGFGPPLGDKPLDQPWAHAIPLGVVTPVDPPNRADNTPIIGPAGIVHMSMQDLAIYGWNHLRGEKVDGGLLKSATFKKVHEPQIEDYGHGWVTSDYDWADGRLVWHNGSNTMWYSALMLIPSRNMVLVFVTNVGTIQKAEREFIDLAEEICEQTKR